MDVTYNICRSNGALRYHQWMSKKCEKRQSGKTNKIRLTPERVNALMAEYERTGVGIRRLFVGEPDVPNGLDAALICRWLDRRTDTADSEHYDFVLQCWQDFPDKTQVKITPAMRDEFAGELARTGIAIHALCRSLPPKPFPPSQGLVRSWLSDREKTTKQAYWDAVMDALKALPDQVKPNDSTGSRRAKRGRTNKGPGSPPDVLDMFE